METTIKVSHEVKNSLDKMKIFERETYNDVISVLIEDNLNLNKKTELELSERMNIPKLISHDEVRKKLGL